MLRIAVSFALSLCFALTFISCGSSSPDAVAKKIEAGQPLTEDDYDVMLGYLAEATDRLVPRLKEARTVEDMEAVDADNRRQFPHTDLFGATLLHDYPRLTAKQSQRLTELRDNARKALSH